MDSVGILRVLWRRPLALGVGVLLAAIVCVFGMYRVSPAGLEARSTTLGYAKARALVDTPTSLIADAEPKGAAAIAMRTSLLGSLLGGEESRAAIAEEVGQRPAEIGVIAPGADVPVVVNPLAQQAIEVARPREPYVVAVEQAPGLPILAISTAAPGAEAAGGLVRAATRTLASLAAEAQGAGGEVRIEQLGGIESGTREVGSGKAKGLLVGAIFFVLWCAGIVVLDGFMRHRKDALAWQVAR